MSLVVHFLNVGHGDCTVVEHPSGRLTVIDINNGDELDWGSREELASQFNAPRGIFDIPPNRHRLAEAGYSVALTNPIEFLARVYAGRKIFRYVQTHPDMDHMRGLSALIASGKIPANFWDTQHGKEPEIQERDRDDWETYLNIRNGHMDGVTVLNLHRGSRGPYYNQGENNVPGGDGIEILSPSPELRKWADENELWNELSYILRISHGERSIILGGDAGEIAWQDVYEHYGNNLKTEVLKASHHGRDSGYHKDAVQAMSPVVTIVSVGKKPDTDASNKYRTYSKHVWSTRWKGNITIEIPGDVRQPFLYEWENDR